MLTKDAAICIRAIDYSETSQILTLFTRATGKISAIAKGSKRPKSSFDGPVEAFSSGKIVFTATGGEKLATLTEFQQQPSFPHLRDNLFTLNCALFAAELVNHLTHEYDPHPELFDSFLQFLQNLNEQRAMNNERRSIVVLLILFQLALLKEVGLQPVLSHCVNCKMSSEQLAASDEVYFTSAANGLICRDCEAAFTEKIKLTKNAAACLSNLRILARTNEKTLKEIEKILIYHFTNILGRPLKMAKHVTRCS
jgi:DNA repair protein RecO (recombination protein O)